MIRAAPGADADGIDIDRQETSLLQLGPADGPEIKVIGPHPKVVHPRRQLPLVIDKLRAARAKGRADSRPEISRIRGKVIGHGPDRRANDTKHTAAPTNMGRANHLPDWIMKDHRLTIGLLDQQSSGLVGYQDIVTVGLKILSRFPVNDQHLVAMDLSGRHHGLKAEGPFKPGPVFSDSLPVVANSKTDIQGSKSAGTHAAVPVGKTMTQARQIKGIKL
jgi:hypothetical protein